MSDEDQKALLREQQLVRAWDFLEHWHNRLAKADGEHRLGEFYRAMIKFLQREGVVGDG